MPRFGVSLRYRFLAVFLLIFLGGALASYAVVSWVSRDIVRTLTGWFAEKNVLYEKSKVLQLMPREIVLAQKMASSPTLKAWVRAEQDPQVARRAIAELEDFRRMFRSRSYFFAIASSGNYYFNDEQGGHDLHRPRYSLSEANPKDGWFYATLRKVDDYELNVDTDRFLKLTKVWINQVLKDDGQPLAVIGTGVDLSDFIQSVISSTQPGVTNLLLDRNGAVQAHHDVSRIDFASIAKQQRHETQHTVFDLCDDQSERTALQAALAALAGGAADTRSLELSIQGQRYIAGIAYLSDIKWFLVTLTDPASASSQRYIGAVATVLIVALAITLLIAIFVFDRLVLRRLSALDAAVRKVGAGDFALDLPDLGSDELGRLGRAFREMAKRIAAHTSNLEHEVAARTEVLERLAYADALTGLLNRRGMLDRIDMERNRLAREGGKLGVMIIDIDHFKRINDSHGHDLGDRALVAVARTIRELMRVYDVCGRWGGEEFLVILPGAADNAALMARAERLRSEIKARPIPADGQAVALTVSIGCYVADPSETIDAMVKAADDALYEAKEGGRDRVIVAGA